MKKTFFYSILFFSISFFLSCSSDDTDNMENTDFAALVVGEWLRTASTINGAVQTTGCATGLKVTFGSDGFYGESPFNDTCTSTGNTGTYSVNGAEIEVVSGFFAATLEIVSLNENMLIYRYTSSSDNLIEQRYSKL